MKFVYKNKMVTASTKKEAISKILASDEGFITVNGDIDSINYKQYIGKKVNVIGDVDLENLKLEELPITFGYVKGDFLCSYNKLTNLEGAPEKVGGDFYCKFNQLTTLKGCPKEVGNDFDCSYNKITSLKGAPRIVGGDFYCSHNQLTNLIGAPEKVGKDFYCSYNKITSLKGAPKKVGWDFNCSANLLTSLEGAPKEVGKDFYCYKNKVEFTEEDVRGVSNVKRNIYRTASTRNRTASTRKKAINKILASNEGFITVKGDINRVNYKQYIGKKVNVGGEVDLENLKLEELPITFGYVKGNFLCGFNKLTNLEGAPEKVGGNFYCYKNKLTSLKGAPKKVGGSFNCSYNKLTNLEGAPKEVGGSFYGNKNKVEFTEEDVREVSNVKRNIHRTAPSRKKEK